VATLAMTTMLGALSMVVDAGVFFVIQRQLQNAADAAALAAVWYDPACISSSGVLPNDTMDKHGCQNFDPNLWPFPAECSVPPNVANMPCSAAVAAVKANWSSVLGLCAGPNLPAGTIPVHITAYPGVAPPAPSPQLPPYVVSVSCDAPRWFARVLPGLSATVHLNGNASAALGWLGPSGQLQATPPAPPIRLVARLMTPS